MLNYAGGNPITAYNLTRSLRFRRSASAWLSRTPASTTNQKTFTFSTWLKRGQLGVGQTIFNAGTYAQYGAFTTVGFDPADTISVVSGVWAVSTDFTLVTGAVFRDPSAWYHVVLQVDTTQATASNRIRVYVNNVLQTFASGSQPTQNLNTAINANIIHGIGAPNGSGSIFDGYLAETYFLDGQALTPSSFGSFNSTTGVWQPARYTGTYGTNGFYLPFTDNSSLTTSSNVGLGKDFSGNGNYWTTNNISITSGVTYDSMTDVPTLTSATAANFAVLNKLDANSNLSITDGNLKISTTVGNFYQSVRGTIAIPATGKFYFECINQAAGTLIAGIDTVTAALPGSSTGAVIYDQAGNIQNNGTLTGGYATLTTGDVLAIAVDVDVNKIYFYKNNVLQNTGGSTIAISAPYSPLLGVQTAGSSVAINFGQRPFQYTPPSGYVALNTYNLPDSTIKKGSTAMNIALDTGANIKTTTEALFPANYFEWIKDRANADNHQLIDIVRGSTAVLQSNTTNAETTYVTPAGSSVGWAWKANGTAVSNTNGTITSQVSANASAGFSVVTYTGTGANATVGHGLGVAPSMMIVKNRTNAATSWGVYHISLGAGNYILLSSANPSGASSALWNSTSPTPSVFSVGTDATTNQNAIGIVAYCFAGIAGFSSFGSYTGNGSADGPFIYTGFRPKFVLIKNADATESWNTNDTSRSPYNLANALLFSNATAAEAAAYGIDFLSNGIKIRNTSTQSNANGQKHIYAAFAENPFKNSLAR